MIECRFEDGNEAQLRHAVVDALVVNNDQILLIRRAESLVEGGKLALPGGFIDRDETIVEATRREVLEESGYESGDVSLFAVISNPARGGNDDRQTIAMLMLVEPGERVGEMDWEVTEVMWVPLDSVPFDELAFDHGELIQLYLERRDVVPLVPILK